MKKFTLLLLAMLLLPLAAGAQNNAYVDETRHVESFNRVLLLSNFNVVYHEVTSADSVGMIRIHAEDFMMSEIETIANRGELTLRLKPAVKRNFGVMLVHLYGNNLTQVEANGSSVFEIEGAASGADLKLSVLGDGQIRAKNLNYNRINATLRGSGYMKLGGKALIADYSMLGNGELLAHDLVVNDIKISIKGTGDIGCNATKNLNVSIWGSGDVYYMGTPTIKERAIGSGELRPMPKNVEE